jgi:hypothetical protein
MSVGLWNCSGSGKREMLLMKEGLKITTDVTLLSSGKEFWCLNLKLRKFYTVILKVVLSAVLKLRQDDGWLLFSQWSSLLHGEN